MKAAMTGGEVFVEGLVRNGVKDLFFIPGIQLDWAVEALRKRAGEINLYVPRHEQTTTYMADGYYRVTGKTGTAMVVPGPGALNAGAGLATAYASGSRMVFVTPQIHADGVGKGYGLLHEIKDQSGFVQGLTKWHRFVGAPADIGASVDAAYAQAGQGRARPVGLEIPHNYFQAEVAGQDEAVSPARPAEPPMLDEQAIAAAARR
ncbi:thiamine pyrophosphate-binding protein [Bordetella bronchiseptica]|uniref:thiamine pyrophosphate-binding protein n=1 Tax=Bordetella bronchiseptica TaxID=518 RepID=UPI001FB19160|nr:thiamine pyrophosphate-binding protein [Bordetella bronchiseptica]